MSEYELIYNRDILLAESHKATLASYTTRRILAENIDKDKENDDLSKNNDILDIKEEMHQIKNELHLSNNRSNSIMANISLISWLSIGWSTFLIYTIFVK